MLNQTVFPLPGAPLPVRAAAGIEPGADAGPFGALLAAFVAPPVQLAGTAAAPALEMPLAAAGRQGASSPADAPGPASMPAPAGGAGPEPAGAAPAPAASAGPVPAANAGPEPARPVPGAAAGPVPALPAVSSAPPGVPAPAAPPVVPDVIGGAAPEDGSPAASSIAELAPTAAPGVVPRRPARAPAVTMALELATAPREGLVEPAGIAPDGMTSGHAPSPSADGAGAITRAHYVQAPAAMAADVAGVPFEPGARSRAGPTPGPATPVRSPPTAAVPPAPGAERGALAELSAHLAREAGDIRVPRAEPATLERVPAGGRPAAAPAAPVEQLQLHLVRAVHGRVERLVVQLEPADLGRVEIQLDFGDDGRVGAVITAERPETLDALQRDAHGLERSLRDAGLRPDGGGLSFSLKRDREQAGDGERRGSGGSRQARAADHASSPADTLNLRLRLLDISA